MGLILNPYRFAEEQAIIDQIRTTNLQGFWDAGDSNSYPGSGTTWSDLSAAGKDLTLSGSYTWNASGWFDFTGGNATITDNTLARIGNAAHTLLAWVNFDVTSRDVFHTGTSLAGDILTMGFNNAVRGHCWTTSGAGTDGNTLDGLTTLSTGTWYFIGQRVNSSRLDVWLNNAQDNTRVLIGTLGTGTRTVFAFPSNRVSLDGQLGMGFVYDAYLSDSEIQTIYSVTSGRFP